jgi:hypothetical protein
LPIPFALMPAYDQLQSGHHIASIRPDQEHFGRSANDGSMNLSLWRFTMKTPPARLSTASMLLAVLSLGILTRPLIPVRTRVSAPSGDTASRRRRFNPAQG